MRQEKGALRKRWRQAREEEKEGLETLWRECKLRHKELLRKERRRKRRAEKRKASSAFLRNPYAAARSVLDPPTHGCLQCSKSDFDAHLKETYAHGGRDTFRVAIPDVERPAEPRTSFKLGKFADSELSQVVHKSRASSAPGPNGVSYRVYKYCPQIRAVLFSLLRSTWTSGNIPCDWQVAEGCLIPKVANAAAIGDFRHISLLNVEGKIFFAVVARRLQDFLSRNSYVDTRVQKGATSGCPGVLEHVASLFDMVGEARRNRKTLHVVFCDVANAFGSVPHRVIFRALEHYHVPERVRTSTRALL